MEQAVPGLDRRALDDEVGCGVAVAPRHESALTAGDDRHPALDEEGESAEHPLLDNIRAGAEQPPDPFGQVFVIRHAMDGSPPVRPSARARRDGSR